MKSNQEQKKRRGQPSKKVSWDDNQPITPGHDLFPILPSLFQEFARILYLQSIGELELDPLKVSLRNKLLKLAIEHNRQKRDEYAIPLAINELLPLLKNLYFEIKNGRIASHSEAEKYAKDHNFFLPKRCAWILFQTKTDRKEAGCRSWGDLAKRNIAIAFANASYPQTGKKLARRGQAVQERYEKWDFSSLDCVGFILDILFDLNGESHVTSREVAKHVLNAWKAKFSEPKLSPINRQASTAIFNDIAQEPLF